MQNSKIDDARIVRIFSIIYGIALLYALGNNFGYITRSVTQGCGGTELPLPATWLYSAMLLFIFIGTFARNNIRFVWLGAAALYFILFRRHVMCQAGPQGILPASNHIMVFWVFLTLGLLPLMKDSRVFFLLRFFILFSYFAGGIAKARHGLEWMNGYSLQYHFLKRHIFLDLPLAVALVSNLTMAKAISWFVVLTELSIPVVLFNKKIEYFYAACFFIFQIICLIVLDLKFMQYYGWIYLIYVAIFLNRLMAIRDRKE